MKIGFIGLGNVGGKLAGSLLRNGFLLKVNDLNPETAQDLIEKGAGWAETPMELAESSDLIITCLPSPHVVREVMESRNGVLEGFQKGSVWMEMSTTDEQEIRRLGEKVEQIGGRALEAPVSGGCHRAVTGNISIFVGGQRVGFDRVFTALQAMGRKILCRPAWFGICAQGGHQLPSLDPSGCTWRSYDGLQIDGN